MSNKTSYIKTIGSWEGEKHPQCRKQVYIFQILITVVEKTKQKENKISPKNSLLHYHTFQIEYITHCLLICKTEIVEGLRVALMICIEGLLIEISCWWNCTIQAIM